VKGLLSWIVNPNPISLCVLFALFAPLRFRTNSNKTLHAGASGAVTAEFRKSRSRAARDFRQRSEIRGGAASDFFSTSTSLAPLCPGVKGLLPWIADPNPILLCVLFALFAPLRFN
jgi:hypothetical protein